jgi:hypothetical protein
MRRTNADKRRAVETLLRDEEWGKWSDREIASRTETSAPLVASVRLTVNSYSDSERTYTTKHGSVATMRTAGIGRGSRKPDIKLPGAPSLYTTLRKSIKLYAIYCKYTQTVLPYSKEVLDA